jgi:hypothetical protein
MDDLISGVGIQIVRALAQVNLSPAESNTSFGPG